MQKTTFELGSGPKNANKDSKLNRVKNRKRKRLVFAQRVTHVRSTQSCIVTRSI